MNLRRLKLRSLELLSPAVLTAIGVVATLILSLVIVIVLLLAGGAKAVSDNAALIGALIALGGVFTAQMVGIALDDRRAQESRDLEAERANEAALRIYLEQVGKLLIEQPLRRASPGDNLSTVVRAQTLALLEGLAADRKRILLQFLYESGLILKDRLVVSLATSDLSGANLGSANLRGTDLRGANLGSAKLSFAKLSLANLSGADLNWADLSGADLSGADLRFAILDRTDLSGADLSGAILTQAQRRNADLYGPNLSGADLSGADLSGADLHRADLSGTNFTGVILDFADLSGAAGICHGELEQLAASLAYATMPDGSEYR